MKDKLGFNSGEECQGMDRSNSESPSRGGKSQRFRRCLGLQRNSPYLFISFSASGSANLSHAYSSRFFVVKS